MEEPDFERAAEIRKRVDALDAERDKLFREYCTIFQAGVVDESDFAWARGESPPPPPEHTDSAKARKD